MGSNYCEIRVPLRISNHNSEQDDLDRAAVDALKRDIQAIIDSEPAYQRIATIGVEGGW